MGSEWPALELSLNEHAAPELSVKLSRVSGGFGECRISAAAPRIAHKLLPSHLPAALLLPWRCCRRKGGKRKGTGVKYDDVAGIDHIKSDVKEVRLQLEQSCSRQTQQADGRLGPAVVLSQGGCRMWLVACQGLRLGDS